MVLLLLKILYFLKESRCLALGAGDPSSNLGGPIRFSWSKQHIDEIIFQLEMQGVTKKQIDEVRDRLLRFSETMCYRCNLNDIIIYINELKTRLSPWTYRKYVVDIRRLLRLIDPAVSEKIKLPSTPKRREIVLRPRHIKELINQVELLRAKSERLRLKAGILVSATSGIRAEELYKLRVDDIDIREPNNLHQS